MRALQTWWCRVWKPDDERDSDVCGADEALICDVEGTRGGGSETTEAERIEAEAIDEGKDVEVRLAV